MLMKSSNNIPIGNGNKCRENQKISTSSSAYTNKCITSTSQSLNVEQQQQLNDFIQPAQSFYTNSLSSFQSESISSSKFQFEITPETVRQLNKQYRSKSDHHRTRIKWVATRQTSLTNSKSSNLTMTNELVEFPSSSEQDKTFVDQSSQAILSEIKQEIKKKLQRKSKSASSTKRSKAPSATPISSQIDLTKTAVITAKIEETNTGKNMITVDTTKARSNLEVVRMCLKDLGWKECSTTTTLDSDIYWHSSSFHEGNVPFNFTSGRVNKFPGMNELLRKVHLTRSLNNMRILFPNEFDFYPKTWFLPEQSQQFRDDVRYIHQLDKKHNRPQTTFIVKPSDGSQGEGIYLLRDPAHCIVTNRPHVAQEYIERPLLLNGLKFDLRIYVLVLNLYPLEVFLYDEGLVRFATVDYKAPSTDNLHQTFMHLTNYSLNKRSAAYKHTIDNNQTDGSKRKLSSVWTQLIEIFGNDRIDRTKTLITEMINKTILAILPELRVEYEFELPLGKKQNISCFQIIGFDIILTENLKPILLEVNANPSLRVDFDKENETGKLIYQPSPIDEEIKKPLVLETLKLALPKKKLQTFTRHAQLQYNDELMAQRVEKVAQRRVVERNEKLKSERKTRFDLRSNPFFSRPPDIISKDFQRLQQEQQQQQDHLPLQRVLITTPTNLAESSLQFTTITAASDQTMNSLSPSPINRNSSPKPKQIIRKSKKSLDSTDDDDESGSLPDNNHRSTRSNLFHSASASIRRPIMKSASSSRQLSSTDATMISSIKKLKMIFPLHYKSKYRHLFLLDKIAYIYIQLVIMLGHKTMTGGQFRSFANICGITNETITAPSIDILYYQILRKWQQFVLRSTASTGLPFAAFIEAFFLLSQRKFPTSHSLLDSVSQLVNVCVRNLNACLHAPSSPLIQQSNQYLLQRATRLNSSTNPTTSTNNRSSFVALRSTTTSTNRLLNAPSSAPTPRSQPLIPAATTTTTAAAAAANNSSEDKNRQASAKSVFPLFFDVL